MSKALFALERRFERRSLTPFIFLLIAFALVAVAHSEWLLIAVCVGAAFATGVIGYRLNKNRHKPRSQLEAGSEEEPETVLGELDPSDTRIVTGSAIKFMFVVVITFAALAYAINRSFLEALSGAAVGWVLWLVLLFATFYKAKKA